MEEGVQGGEDLEAEADLPPSAPSVAAVFISLSYRLSLGGKYSAHKHGNKPIFDPWTGSVSSRSCCWKTAYLDSAT